MTSTTPTPTKARASIKPSKPKDPIIATGRVFAWIAVLVCLVPILLIVVVATTRQWRTGIYSGGFTLDWIIQGFDMVAINFAYSFQIAVIVLLLNLAIGFPAAWLFARRQFPGRRIAMAITQTPLAIPGIALAIGLIMAYGTGDLKRYGILLVFGHLLYTLPFFIATMVPVLGGRRLQELEQVALTLGAGGVRRFLTVTVPHVKTALLGALILVVTLSLGEFNVSFFVFSPTDPPLPMELHSSHKQDGIEIASAVTVWFLAFVVPAAIILERLGGAKVSASS
ncbi:putative spermidine/putrescine transport system permease protein [Stackebrandtia endophytica]|uniref:Putative spermidine/putrescine transport system permease protein n=1 Tax=Stackebrandtia endophytica TaxID=1496996 RepID=A0A543B282_9ACTN|nr:ABC transporter permease subunit [Stackebrandtia endophytica]TQL78840.1 putative spermidine/putrescine transport system permease protein [Stackebrandtia endophytica]